MELHQLSAFVAVAEELHFSRAARRLFMSQSALSRLIRSLETEMDVVLFERSTRHVALTPAGDRFLREARVVLGQVDVAVRAAQAAGSSERKVLRVGYSDATEVALADALQQFRIDRPDVALSLREVDRTRLAGPPAGECEWDVVLCRERVDGPETTSQHVRDEPLWVALPAGHPLAARRLVTLDHLDGTPPLMLPPGLFPHVRAALSRRQPHDWSPSRLVQDVPTFAAAAVLVSAGLGVTIAPQSMCATLGLPGTVFRPLADRKLYVPVYAVLHRQSPSEHVMALMRALRSPSPWPNNGMQTDVLTE